MIEMTLHPTPSWRDVVREQLDVVGLSLRREALVAAIVVAVATVMVVTEILSGGPGFDSGDPFPTAFFSFLFPFIVWRREQRFGPSFLWTLPVDRRRMALAKVFAGWVWMIAAVALFVLWLLPLAVLAHVSPMRIVMRLPLTTTVAAYLFGSALVLGLRHPLRWLLGVIGGLLLLMRLTEVMGRTATGEWRIVTTSGMGRWAIYGPYGLRTLLSSSGFFSAMEEASAVWEALPLLAQWGISAVVWIGAGLLLLWAAASRHRELRP